MIKIRGQFFDGKTSKAYDAVLESDGTHISIKTNDEYTLLATCDLKSSCKFTPKLGMTPRIIRFKGGQQFESKAFLDIEALESKAGLNKAFYLISGFENRWKAVAACIVGLILFVAGFVNYGIPAMAKKVAFSLPQGVMTQMGLDTEMILDQRFFTPTTLDDEKINLITQKFLAIVQNIGYEESFSLQFRQSKILGANAFALPSGLIIVTDKLVQTSEDIREIEAILIHEMAHVQQRHGLRSVIQNTGVFLLVSMLVGDVTSITSLAASIPTLLVEMGYSRKFETEADQEVGKYFLAKGWDVKAFEDILIRITKGEPRSNGTELISTHPDTLKRIQALKQFVSERS